MLIKKTFGPFLADKVILNIDWWQLIYKIATFQQIAGVCFYITVSLLQYKVFNKKKYEILTLLD